MAGIIEQKPKSIYGYKRMNKAPADPQQLSEITKLVLNW